MHAICGENWKEIAEAARKEQDPEKLIQLVRELNEILEERQARNAARTKTGTHKNGS